jgi:peptidyl-prolyl cis-trans isomerase D
VGSSTFVTNSEILENLRLAEQTRDVQFIRLNLQAILNNVTTTTEDVKNFYNNNSQLFLTSKLAKIKYIELSSKNLEEDVSIGESALREEYDLYLENFDTSVKKTISHLMLNIDEGENKSEVIALAKELKSQVMAGSNFIELVKEYSDDEGTKDNGGELGVTDGSVFPPEFEEVIALMEEGSLSDPVELDESIHLLLLKDTQTPIADTFEEKREAILSSISEDLASDRFVELLDQASDLSFSLNDLEAIAKELNLSTQAVDYFSKEGASEVLSNPKVLELLFENLDFQNDPTIEVVETQENEALIILLEDFKQQEVTPFDSVELQATVMYKKELATGALDELEAQIIDTLDTGSNLALIATEQNVELESYQDLSRNSSLLSGSVMLDIFNLPRTNLDKAFGSSKLDNGDSIVYRLKAINDKETAITPEEKLTFREFIGEERQVSELSELQLASQQSANIIRKF